MQHDAKGGVELVGRVPRFQVARSAQAVVAIDAEQAQAVFLRQLVLRDINKSQRGGGTATHNFQRLRQLGLDHTHRQAVHI
ncbi:hypothetical protein D9M68_995960 [compost metagenome]